MSKRPNIVDEVHLRLKLCEIERVLMGPVPASYLRDTREETLDVQRLNALMRVQMLLDDLGVPRPEPRNDLEP